MALGGGPNNKHKPRRQPEHGFDFRGGSNLYISTFSKGKLDLEPHLPLPPCSPPHPHPSSPFRWSFLA